MRPRVYVSFAIHIFEGKKKENKKKLGLKGRALPLEWKLPRPVFYVQLLDIKLNKAVIKSPSGMKI